MAKAKFDKVECEFCGKRVDIRGIKNHQENCPKNPANAGKEVTEELDDFEEGDIEEDVVDDVVVTGDQLVDILPNQNIKSYYGNKWYFLVNGEKTKVPKGFKQALAQAGMLKPL